MTTIRRTAITIVLFGIGLLLAASLLTGEWLQPLTTRAYRIAYLVLGPITGGATLAAREGDIMASLLVAIVALALPPVGFVLIRIGVRRRRARVATENGMSRRRFLEVSGGAIVAVGAGTVGYGVLCEPDLLRVREYRLPIRDLPEYLDGIVIAHVSDTHYGPFVTLPFLRAVVDRVNAMRPDAIVLTGDYVHRTPRAIEPGIEVLRGLRSRFGAVAVLGNHDHWEGADACRAMFGTIGIPLIDNTRRFLTRTGIAGAVPESGLCIGGVGDLWEDDVLLDRALEDVPASMPRIVLAHNPDFAEQIAAAQRVDVLLSGHTHGGQIRLAGIGTPVVPSRFGQKYAGGLCEGPRCRVLVSRGVGMAMLPVRLGVPPEIGRIVLTRV